MKPSTSISRSLRFGRSLIRKVKNCFTGYKPTESASGSKERSCNLSETISCGDGGYGEMIQNAIIYCKDSLIKEELNDGSKEVFADENDEAGKSRQIHYDDAAIDRLLNRDQLGDEDATMDDEEDDGFLKAFKEKEKAQEEHRQNRIEYRQYLETCGFIKVNTQWRKVQDRLEDDERCSRLEKFDRFEIFQEYIRDLEKEEEEQRRIQKEQLKRAERKNRDEFRKMMEEHVASGILTAKTHWRDYCMKVKDSSPYQAVALNTSGSTPKDLFEDVAEELEKLIDHSTPTKGKLFSHSWSDWPSVEDTKPSSLDWSDSMPLQEETVAKVSDSVSPDWSSEAKPAMVGAGLANLGNTCFLNAILQCFTHIVPLVQGLRSYNHPRPCDRDNEGFCVICTLRDHIEYSITSMDRVVSPWKLVDNLNYISSNFGRFQQEDAHEFLQCLLDRLDNCCIYSQTKDTSLPSADESLVKQVFGGRLISKLQCCNCGHSSDTYEPLIDLSLEIENVGTLPSALESFTKVEKIDPETKFTCEQCKEKVSVEKQLILNQAPSVAAFHLKRFKNDGSYVEKIDKHVEFPLELDLLPYTGGDQNNDVELKYNLYAVVVHVGFSSTSGHYYCFCRSAPDAWYRLDDSKVTTVREDFVLSQEAYILFYAKEGTPWFSSFMETVTYSIPRNHLISEKQVPCKRQLDNGLEDSERKHARKLLKGMPNDRSAKLWPAMNGSHSEARRTRRIESSSNRNERPSSARHNPNLSSFTRPVSAGSLRLPLHELRQLQLWQTYQVM